MRISNVVRAGLAALLIYGGRLYESGEGLTRALALLAPVLLGIVRSWIGG